MHRCIIHPQWVNTLRLWGTYIHQWTRTSLVQVRVCHLSGAKPLLELTLICNPLGHNQNTVIFIQEIAFDNVVCQMAAILSRLQCFKSNQAMDSWPVNPTLDKQQPSTPGCLEVWFTDFDFGTHLHLSQCSGSFEGHFVTRDYNCERAKSGWPVDYFTVSLHNPNGRQFCLPLGLCKGLKSGGKFHWVMEALMHWKLPIIQCQWGVLQLIFTSANHTQQHNCSVSQWFFPPAVSSLNDILAHKL